MNYKWKRKIIGGLSFSTALFIFQACYGTPQDFGTDILIDGHVISKTTKLPIKGIKVSIANNIQYDYTDENGYFSFYTEIQDSLKIKFEDIDSTQNGVYNSKDTLFINSENNKYLNIELEEK